MFDDFDRPGTTPPSTPGSSLSPAGQEALEKIQHYYVNIAVWLAPPALIQAMNDQWWWDLVWSDRVVEATLLDLGDDAQGRQAARVLRDRLAGA